MTRDGLIEEQPGSRWRLTDLGFAEAKRAEAASATAARTIVRKFGNMPVDDLMSYVYARNKWFTVNSKRERLAQRTVARPAVYTVGYEGLLIDGFLNGLLRHGITRLIDVRHNPVARRYGFHKSTLDRLCGKVGVHYQHVPELGIPSSDRQGLIEGGTVARQRLFSTYVAKTLASQRAAIASVATLVLESATALMCMEADPCDCHRSHLAKPVSEMTGLPIQHVRIEA